MEKVTLEELLSKDIKNKVICFPTDTVYGVGSRIEDIEAIKRIYQLKHRDQKKPLAILVGKASDINPYVNNINEKSQELMEKYWPGALTIIFEKNDKINDEVTSNLKTVAFRMPNSKIALDILNKFGLMATTSVNISGQKEMNSVDDIYNEFYDDIDYIVTDYQEMQDTPSTVVDGTTLKVLRQGKIKL